MICEDYVDWNGLLVMMMMIMLMVMVMTMMMMMGDYNENNNDENLTDTIMEGKSKCCWELFLLDNLQRFQIFAVDNGGNGSYDESAKNTSNFTTFPHRI